jgi:catechol 2,3-dioxygenase-like lactoylglutathione lyase family enzyme
VRLIERSQVGAEPAALIAEDQVEAVDHVVIRSAAPDRARELFGDALGIRLALDRELAGTRMLFFRVGGVTIEVIGDASLGELDAFYGLAYRVRDLARTHARLAAAGFALSEVRPGRKPGTEVFGLRSAICGVPTLFIRDPSRE